MGKIVYLDANDNRVEVSAESFRYADEHWKFVEDIYEEQDEQIAKVKKIPRERVVEVEIERLVKDSEKSRGVFSI